MDEIVRVLIENAPVKAMAISGRDMVERARTIHDTWPVATAALGRTLLAASMLGNQLKDEGGSVTLRLKGGGPLGTVLAVAGCGGNARGYVQNPAVDLPRKAKGKLDVGAAVGKDGTLTLIRDMGMKEPYVGSVALLSGEVAEDLAGYFVQSEQIPTACALGVLVDTNESVLAAGGYLIQLLPGAEEDVIERIEAGVARVGPVSTPLSQGVGPEELLRRVLADFRVKVVERCPVSYRCDCSRERVSRALVSMGRAELAALIEEQGSAHITCQFCDRVYDFNREELEALLEGASGLCGEKN